ncbi:MFS transporter, partial [Leucobacter soli]
AALSGMAQSVGYLIAAAGPIVFGWLLGLGGGSSGAWIAPFALVWLVTAVQIVFGLAVRKPRFVLEPRPER